MKTVIAAALAIACAGSAAAQVSLDELQAGVAARTSELAEFERMLNSEDSPAALAAMQIMIERGDADQRRMAIRHGLYSPDTAIRQTVLRAIFNSNPTLVIAMTPLNEEPGSGYFSTIQRWNGSLQPDNSGTIPMRLTSFDEEEDCWKYTFTNNRDYCGIRMSGEVVSVGFANSWSQYSLNSEGVLAGNHTVSGDIVRATISLAQ